MRKIPISILCSLVALSFITFLPISLCLLKDKNPLLAFDYKVPLYNQKEDFNPSLNRLNSVHTLKVYCDSLYNVTKKSVNDDNYERTYINIVGSVIRKRFYWSYSWYSFSNNYLSVLFSKITEGDYAAIVGPDDIMKYPNAACSQQVIVMMEVFKEKGFKTRKVGFFGNNKSGHFACEVYYKNSWHFRDPTLEPDTVVLNKYNSPSIKFIVDHPDIIFKAYKNFSKDSSYLLDVLDHYSYGEINVFPARKALIFQKATKFLSNTIWIFFLLGYLLSLYWNKYLLSVTI